MRNDEGTNSPQGFAVDSGTPVLLRGEICAFSSSDDVLAPLAVRGISSMAFCTWLTS